MSDGSITIDTSLDNSGIERDVNQARQTLQRAGNEIGNQFQQIGNTAQSSMNTAVHSIDNLQNAMQQTANVAGQQISQSLEGAAQQAEQTMTVIDVTSSGMTTRVIQAGEQLSQGVGNSLGDLGDTINDDVIEPLDGLGDTLGGLGDSIGDPLDGLGEPLEDVRSGLTVIRDGIEEIEPISSEAFGKSISDIDKMAKELEDAEKSTERVKETFSKLGTHIADAMKKAGAAAAAAFSVAMGAAVKVGMDFESGMSQVAATMGITTSEIAAGSKEYEALSQAAKNAGATTQFSATQASEALNYLALAGYDAEKSITALPTVLNLAAAGGIDLGYASDMVTDSMSALGLETNQLGGFVDQLAKTSQKSNTNIAQLGEGILTVGGTAKDLAGGTIELNTALGILADNGVKGAEGGTALRNVILSLSAPTDKAAQTLKDLGLEVFDANGKLRPLNETFQDLDGKLADMTDEEKINVLNTLFNKVDLKSVNALLANSGERFDELSGYIRDSAGAAADMAETMNDNLKGKLTILGSALEGLGIEMYEEFEQPFKEAAETAIKSVDSISYSLKNGKLSESMQTVARAIGSIVSKAAELAINALPKLIDGFAFLVDNAKILGTVLASTAGAVVTFKGVMLVNDMVKSWQAAATAARVFGAGMSTSLTGMQAAIGVATGKLGIMQAAVAAIGSPMGVAALAIAGVTAGIIALSIASKNDVSELERNKKAVEEFTEKLEESQKTRDAIEERRQESINTSFAEIDNTERQIDALNELVDANGKVKKGYEGKAQALAEQINSVIPNAISLSEDESGAYLKVADSIDLMISKKKINALIDANKESYANALKESKEAADKYAEALENQKVAHENLQKAMSDTTSKQEIYDTNLAKAREVFDEANKAVEEFKKQYEESTDTIIEQDNLLTASKSESVEEINAAIASQGVALKQYTSNQLEEADKQLQNEKEKLEKMKILSQDFTDEYTKSQLKAQEETVKKAQAISDNAHAEAEAAFNQAVNRMIENIKNKQGEMLSAGEFLMQGLSNGIKNKEQAVLATAASVAANIMDSFTGIKGFNIGSPSKWAFGVGNFLIQGLANGISKNSTIAINAANMMTQNLKSAVQGSDSNTLADYFYDVGKSFPKSIETGIEKNTSSVIDSIEELAETSLTTAMKQAKEYKEIGELYGENYLSGLEKIADDTIDMIEKNTDRRIEAYQKAAEEERDSRVKEIEEKRDAELEAISDQASALKKGKSEAEKKAYEEQKKAYERQKKQIKEAAKEKTDEIKKGTKEQTDAYKKGWETLAKVAGNTIKNALNDINDEVSNRISAITDEFQSQRDEILGIQESLYSKTSDYGELFHYNDETGKMVLNDLDEINKKRMDYYEALGELEERSSSVEFTKMVASLGIKEAIEYMDILAKMSDSTFQSYVENWERLQTTTEVGAKETLKSQLDVIDAEYNKAMENASIELKEFVKNRFEQVSSEYMTVISEKYPELLGIFQTMLKDVEGSLFSNIDEINTKLSNGLEEAEKKSNLTVLIKAETTDFAQQVEEQTQAVQQAGSELTLSLAETVDDDGDKVVDEADNIAKESITTMRNHEGEFEDVGELYVDALTNGMRNKWGNALGVASDIARSLKEELEDVASFSVGESEKEQYIRQMVENTEPALLSRLYDSMVDAVNVQQSRVAAAATSYITNSNQYSTTTNLGDVNFNIAEVKGNDVRSSVSKLMEQAEFYRRQRNLSVGVR